MGTRGVGVIRFAVATLVELLGIFAIVAGVWVIYPPAGLIVTGIGCVAIGLAIDPPPGRERRTEQ